MRRLQKTGVFENFWLNLWETVKKFADVDFSIQHVCRKSKKSWIEAQSAVQKFRFWEFLLEFSHFMRKMWRKLQMSTLVINAFSEKRQMLNWSTICNAKDMRFWAFLLEFEQFCEKILKKIADVDFSIQHVCRKAKHAELKHNFQCKKHAFLSISAWICAILWEKREEICGSRLQYSTYLQKSEKCLAKKKNFNAKNKRFWECLVEFVQICEESCRCRLQFSLYICRKSKSAELQHNLQCKKLVFLRISAWICAILL